MITTSYTSPDFGEWCKHSIVTILVAVFFTALVLNPLWAVLDLHVPNEPTTKVDFTLPVDSVFYVRNAEFGYVWNAEAPTSIWFHPLLVWGMNLFPAFVPHNVRFWCLSILFGFLALIALFPFTKTIAVTPVRPHILLLLILLPGGIGIATGNAEFPTLLFTTMFLLSIINESSYMFPIFWGILSILTKPNALYMLPITGVYLIVSLHKREYEVVGRSVLGMTAILVGWIAWVAYIDVASGTPGAYWHAREVATVPITEGVFTFLHRTARILLHSPDNGEKLKFLTALVVPLVDMWVLLIVRIKTEAHRFAILAGLIATLALVFILNNPNKVIVYVTTYPGHFIIGLLFFEQTLFSEQAQIGGMSVVETLVRRLAGLSYLVLCVLLMVFFIIGTALGWYY